MFSHFLPAEPLLDPPQHGPHPQPPPWKDHGEGLMSVHHTVIIKYLNLWLVFINVILHA